MPQTRKSKPARPNELLTFEAVRQIALEMLGVEEAATHGSPAFKIKGKLLAWIPANKKDVEPNTLAVRMDLDQRQSLLEEAPAAYYVTDHYVGYPAVLVRLAKIDRSALKDLLNGASRFVTRSVFIERS